MVGFFCLPWKDETTSDGTDQEVHVQQRDALTEESVGVNIHEGDEVVQLFSWQQV